MAELLISPESVTPKELDSGKTVYNVVVADREEKTGWNTWNKAIADALVPGVTVKVEYTEKTSSSGWVNRTIQAAHIDGKRIAAPPRQGGADLTPLLAVEAQQGKQLDTIISLLERIANALPQPIPAGTPRAPAAVDAPVPSSPPLMERVPVGSNVGAPSTEGVQRNPVASLDAATGSGAESIPPPAPAPALRPEWIDPDLWGLLLATGKRPQILPAYLRGMLGGDGKVPVPGSAERVALEARLIG